MIALLSNLFRLLAEYVRHRTETDLDRRIRISRRELRKMASEIDRLRADGAADATQRADWLLGEYIGEAKHLAHLRARRRAAETGGARPDQGRDTHSAG